MATENLIVHVGEIGKIFRFVVHDDGVIRNISSFTAGSLHFEKPDGTILTQTASLTTDGTDGAFQYATDAAADLPDWGDWFVQGEWTESANNFYTPRVPFQVEPVLA